MTAEGPAASAVGRRARSGADLPGVNGVDDLLGAWGPERTLALFEQAKAPAIDAGLVKRLATAICRDDYFAQDAGGTLYRFESGVYVAQGHDRVRRRVKALLDEWKQDAKWSPRRADDVAEYIRVDAPRLWESPPLDVLNVASGLLDVGRRALRQHSPDFLGSVQLPVRFDPGSRSERWDWFISTTFPEDALAVAYEIAAWLMLPDTSKQKALLASGEGANGKSTWLDAIGAFLGRRNVAAVPLHRLESDRFSVARLIGKLANVCADLPARDLEGTSTFKALTGGDTMLAERKYADSFEFRPFARLAFSANHLPRSSDASAAFFRRWVVIPFTRIFEGGAAVSREVLDRELQAPTELSGLLNRALDVLPAVRERGIAESDSMIEAREDFRETTDPLAVWLDRETVVSPNATVSKAALLHEYLRHAERLRRPAISSNAFGRALRRYRPGLDERQLGPEKVWSWVGLGLRSNQVDML